MSLPPPKLGADQAAGLLFFALFGLADVACFISGAYFILTGNVVGLFGSLLVFGVIAVMLIAAWRKGQVSLG